MQREKDMIILEKSLNIWISKILCWMIKDYQIQKKGGIVNTWTIRDEEALNKVKGKCDFVTFENVSKQLEEDFKK